MKRKSLLTLLGFNALTAIGGGFALIFNINTPPQDWLVNTVFRSYLIPGIVLAAVVGGSAALGVSMELAGRKTAALISFLSGMIMIIWILGEIAAVQQYSWLQLIYVVTGSTVMALTYGRARQSLVYGEQRIFKLSGGE